MRRALKVAAATLGVAVMAAVGLAAWGLRHTSPPKPHLTGRIERGTLAHEGRCRSWMVYVPTIRRSSPALVIVLHPSMGSGPQAREMFGYDFDVLADQQGFVVAYPDGIEDHWNDAKVGGAFASKRDRVDDTGFLHALVDELAGRHQVDRSRVFVAGISNGGSMALRLALETPAFARAYAAVIASLPTPDNMGATEAHRAVSILLMNGTNDPMNPWNGGDVALHGVWGHRGAVLSAEASIDYFRALAGLDLGPAVTTFPDRDDGDGSTVERALWAAPGRVRIARYAIKGGGHQVPHPAMYGRRLLGHSNRDIHAAREIWDFFVAASPEHTS